MRSASARILVVEDDVRTRALLKSYLQEMDFRVAVAVDGEQAEARLEKEKIDLMVLDIMLPGEDGLSLCRRLRGKGI
jgi:two-component system phosphate regulon response regulator OmpR